MGQQVRARGHAASSPNETRGESRALVIDLEGALLCSSLVWEAFFADAAACLVRWLILCADFVKPNHQPSVLSGRALGCSTLALVVGIVWPFSIWQNFRVDRLYTEGTREWAAVADWARNSTSATATFLIPNSPDRGGTPEPTPSDLALSRTVTFEFLSHRRIWVDHKRGAAVMWTPSYYRTWWPRLAEVESLKSPGERTDYAARHGIDYVVDRCSPASAGKAIFRTERLCVFPAAPATSGMAG